MPTSNPVVVRRSRRIARLPPEYGEISGDRRAHRQQDQHQDEALPVRSIVNAAGNFSPQHADLVDAFSNSPSTPATIGRSDPPVPVRGNSVPNNSNTISNIQTRASRARANTIRSRQCITIDLDPSHNTTSGSTASHHAGSISQPSAQVGGSSQPAASRGATSVLTRSARRGNQRTTTTVNTTATALRAGTANPSTSQSQGRERPTTAMTTTAATTNQSPNDTNTSGISADSQIAATKEEIQGIVDIILSVVQHSTPRQFTVTAVQLPEAFLFNEFLHYSSLDNIVCYRMNLESLRLAEIRYNRNPLLIDLLSELNSKVEELTSQIIGRVHHGPQVSGAEMRANMYHTVSQLSSSVMWRFGDIMFRVPSTVTRSLQARGSGVSHARHAPPRADTIHPTPVQPTTANAGSSVTTIAATTSGWHNHHPATASQSRRFAQSFSTAGVNHPSMQNTSQNNYTAAQPTSESRARIGNLPIPSIADANRQVVQNTPQNNDMGAAQSRMASSQVRRPFIPLQHRSTAASRGRNLRPGTGLISPSPSASPSLSQGVVIDVDNIDESAGARNPLSSHNTTGEGRSGPNGNGQTELVAAPGTSTLSSTPLQRGTRFEPYESHASRTVTQADGTRRSRYYTQRPSASRAQASQANGFDYDDFFVQAEALRNRILALRDNTPEERPRLSATRTISKRRSSFSEPKRKAEGDCTICLCPLILKKPNGKENEGNQVQEKGQEQGQGRPGDEEKTLKWLSCGHVFHRKCINDWLIQSLTCPIDRKRISYRHLRD